MGALNHQTQVLVSCISCEHYRKCGWWESNGRGQQQIALRARSRASLWSRVSYLWRKGQARHGQLIKHTHTERAGLFDFSGSHWKAYKLSGSHGKWVRNTMKCRCFASPLHHQNQKEILSLDWCKSLHFSAFAYSVQLRRSRQEKRKGNKQPIFHHCFWEALLQMLGDQQ